MKSMKINDLFVKPVDRPIEGVIKADDSRYLLTEVEEYVVTAEVAKGLTEFTERYLDDSSANGVWISGFFGSGKSHLLKIISLVLDSQELPGGGRAVDLLLPRIEDEILRGDITRASKIPSRSILFNIDQKSDAIGGDNESPVLEVFVKVLNELQGYYSKQGHIAQFEYDLDSRGQFGAFKAAYETAVGRTWEEDLPVIETLENETFAKVYADFFKKSTEEGLRLFDRMRINYKVSIESFAKRVKAYIDAQAPHFRLNFFVDEAGQFIGQESKLMLNLQTVAESLATVCKGRSWVFVTSQGDLKSVLGDMKAAQGQDFTKIAARFKTRMTLTSADVREVIQKRLLAKHEAEPEVLSSLYDTEKENLKTLYRFADGSVEYKSWRGSDEFCDYYPFCPYQFDLFQRAIEQLSRHEAFTGRHTAVGERSMLAVFQEVAKALRNEKVGRLATFDLMFEGITASLRGDIQTSVKQAERQLDDDLAKRILKALFLLKWVPQFKSTPRNIAILLIDRPDIEIQKHEKAVRQSLALLESQSYLQRNGDCFEFLTDTEKDIEVEIKNTDIEEAQVAKLLSDVLFQDILRDPKIRYEGNGQDYSYARKLDDQLVGRDADVAVNIITTEHDNHANIQALAAQNTGKPELLAVLPADARVSEDARLFLKTQKYIQQNTGMGVDESRRAILTQRGQQNSSRRSALQALCTDLMGKAPLFLNGSKLNDIGEGDARNRFARGNQSLVSFAFPSLRMLKGAYDDATLTKALLDPSDLLNGAQQSLSEPEQEILTYVMRNQNNGERTSVEEIVRNFGRRPYGWYPMAVLTLLARLFRAGKVELRAADLLDARGALDALKNSRQHGGIRVRMQEQFDAAKVAAVKRFHQEFFDRPNEATDPRSVGQVTSEALAGEARDLQLLLDQASRYHFLAQLEPVMQTIRKLAEKDYAYLLHHNHEVSVDLLTAKQDLIGPVKAFMHGAQRVAYEEVLAFFREEQANFGEIIPDELEPVRRLVDSQVPFRGNVLPQAKAAIGRIRDLIQTRLATERDNGLATIASHEARLTTLPEFVKLSEEQRNQVLQLSNETRRDLATDRFISAIRDRMSRYATQQYPAQLALVYRLGSPKAKTEPGEPARVIAASSLRCECGLASIATEDDLDRWLAALRAAALAELKKGNRISL